MEDLEMKPVILKKIQCEVLFDKGNLKQMVYRTFVLNIQSFGLKEANIRLEDAGYIDAIQEKL